jgi:Ca-activated chloride channel family protein
MQEVLSMKLSSLFSSASFAFAPPAVIALLAASIPEPSRAQEISSGLRSSASNIVVPQRRSFAIRHGGVVEISGVEAHVAILEQTSTTRLDISLRNPTGSRLEAELVVPVPDGAAVRGFSFQGAAKEPTARLLPKDEARRLYEEIVARTRDPALLEFAGYNLIRSSVFPVEARGTQEVRLIYEHVVLADSGRVDYALPRSEALDYAVPWKVTVEIKSKRPISTVYSPSHGIEVQRKAPGEVVVALSGGASTQPGAFRLSYLLEGDGVSASFFAYPDPKAGGGYFLLLAGLPADAREKGKGGGIRRELTLVLDRSGSMNGEKLEQAREAALQIVAGLEPGEAFNIISFSERVDLFSPEPVLKGEETERRARDYLKSLRALSGTNLHDALVEALRQKATPGMLPIVLFLTDGLPTVGQTSEVAIREVANRGNPEGRRVFTFGVGFDVNTPLLERIASATRATATFVMPRENVEVKVGSVFQRLAGPILASPRLEVLDAGGTPSPGRVSDLTPPLLPDLFAGDQLVALGRYCGEGTLRFVLRGNYLGQERAFQFSFDSSAATTLNAFVPRLWASRKIAYLEDAIRDLGAAGGPPHGASPAGDPRLKELVDEIVRLSTEFGILSEYTAFLAEEGTVLGDKDRVLARAQGNFVRRAVQTRSGAASVNQDINRSFQKGQSQLNVRNAFLDSNMNRVSIASVQQVADRAFYHRGGRWIDGQVVNREQETQPRHVVEFGSEEYRNFIARLALDGRQGIASLPGEILVVVGGDVILVKGPAGGQESTTDQDVSGQSAGGKTPSSTAP